MSILGGDFEEQIGQTIESSFVYCDIVEATAFGRLSRKTALMKIGEIIGPLDYTGSKLEFVREYRDIMNELNDETMLKELGLRKILSVSCQPKLSCWVNDSELPGKVRVTLFVRLHSGASTQYQIIYKYIKDTIR